MNTTRRQVNFTSHIVMETSSGSDDSLDYWLELGNGCHRVSKETRSLTVANYKQYHVKRVQ